MFDLEPRVFPLGIFILRAWQWAARRPPLWAKKGGGVPGGAALGKAGLQRGRRGRLGGEGQVGGGEQELRT